jgi:O-acetyl-ADP-ribose deacetylase
LPIHIELGDITRFPADAIVNAANPHLLPGGGVCGAIHGAAGPGLAEACRRYVAEHGRLQTGEAAVTIAGDLPGVSYVIHAVGPVYEGGGAGEAARLGDAYRCAVRTADELGLETIAFPSISTGVFGYPIGLAAPVAVRAVADALATARTLREATFVLFDERTLAAYRSALTALGEAETGGGD